MAEDPPENENLPKSEEEMRENASEWLDEMGFVVQEHEAEQRGQDNNDAEPVNPAA